MEDKNNTQKTNNIDETSSESSYTGRFEFTAEPFYADCKRNLSLPVLGNNLLNCASYHAAQRGFGINNLNDINFTWVISRLAVELTRLPKENEKYSIITWIENVHTYFTNRNFEIIGSNGEIIGYSRSVWAAIDLDSRKPVNIMELHEGEKGIKEYIVEKECPIGRPMHIRVTDGELVGSHKVVYSDIDINGHFNSVKYIEHILDLFPVQYLQSHDVQRFEIDYTAEGYAGDYLQFMKKQRGENEYDIEICKAGKNEAATEIVCSSRIKFR